MNDIQYYVLIRKEKVIEKNQIQEIEKIDLDLITPFEKSHWSLVI